MRRKISLLLCFAMFFMTAHTYAADTEKDITVANANELLDFLNNVEVYKNSSITLENDINLTGISTAFTASGMFDGTFDGNNHSITYVNTTNALFESLGENAVVKNLGIAGTSIGENAASIAVTNNGIIENVKSYVKVMAQSKAGGICVTNNGTVKNCEKSGGTYSSVNATRTGGIAADNMGKVLKCSSFGEVFGNVSQELSMSENVAGVVAYNSGEVSECTNGATVVGNRCTAGVVGHNAGNISLCVNKGSINAQGEHSGGIVGFIKKDKVSCEVSYCDNYGTVTSSSLKCGGVAGSIADSSIRHCVNHGDVTGKSFTAGVLGNAWIGSISLCRNYGNVTAEEDVGGVVGHEAGLNIYACDNYGDITLENGGGRIGGVVGKIANTGENIATAVDSCFNAGTVSVKTSANFLGGIIGKSEQTFPSAPQITNCANVGAIKGTATVGGIICGTTGIIQNCYVKNHSNICVSCTEMSNSFVWSEDTGDEYLNGAMKDKLGKDKWIQGNEYPIPAAVTQIQESYTGGVVSGSDVEFEYEEDKNYVTTLFVPKEYCGPNSLFDIYPEISGTDVNLFMPAEADLSQLTYVTLNSSNGGRACSG